MKEINIIEYSTTPDYHLEVSNKLYYLIRETIENEILAKYTFPKVKSTIFEILVDSEVKTNTRRVIQLSKTGRGEYFSFRFFIPYNIVMKDDKLNISAFINEFMEGIRTALSQFNTLPTELIDNLKAQLIAETADKQEYEYVKSPDELAMDRVMLEFNELLKAEGIKTQKDM